LKSARAAAVIPLKNHNEWYFTKITHHFFVSILVRSLYYLTPTSCADENIAMALFNWKNWAVLMEPILPNQCSYFRGRAVLD
jgi:hypothetical protein